MLIGKPYIILDETVPQKKINIAVYCSSLTYQAMSVQNDTLVVTYLITTGTVNTIQYDSKNLTLSSYAKVTVKLLQRASWQLLGSATAYTSIGAYLMNPYKIFCYIKSLPTATSEIYFLIDMMGSGFAIPAQPATVTLNANQNKMTLSYTETAGTGIVNDLSYSLQASDPSTYNRVEIVVKNRNNGKGKGTTDQSDGDASGDN